MGQQNDLKPETKAFAWMLGFGLAQVVKFTLSMFFILTVLAILVLFAQWCFGVYFGPSYKIAAGIVAIGFIVKLVKIIFFDKK